ncbi:hypothetical protein CMV_015863 [Castanea mollissima]|uniref:Uncharacterized protein n=1 Tax=Castanea mollissima TaxID=60419 RepID=A0A8J4R0S6_9ROSI|nr:hypothetical protein CMV_015863 [Castanea mollissima]
MSESSMPFIKCYLLSFIKTRQRADCTHCNVMLKGVSLGARGYPGSATDIWVFVKLSLPYNNIQWKRRGRTLTCYLSRHDQKMSWWLERYWCVASGYSRKRKLSSVRDGKKQTIPSVNGGVKEVERMSRILDYGQNGAANGVQSEASDYGDDPLDTAGLSKGIQSKKG